jgi:FkbH-like protein
MGMSEAGVVNSIFPPDAARIGGVVSTVARPEGRLDVVAPDHVVGWVWDAASPGKRLTVALELDGGIAATMVADRYRQDLVPYGKTDGRFGFEIELDRPLIGPGVKVRCLVPELSYAIPPSVEAEHALAALEMEVVSPDAGTVSDNPELVRLVIWDLDETFWKGTLTEGGITFLPEHRDIVIELARRGIVSSICSKNDFETVRKVLTEHGVWDYFIFPSINWDPKGPRLTALIEAVQLRAPTVMFIDDNLLNLEEARAYVAGIQVQHCDFISKMLEHPFFNGKDDSALKRLSQYKLLEKRKKDETAAGTDVADFLRTSDIRVQLDFDLENNIDRVIELINRTNQLNFTKIRLPEDPAAARAVFHRTAGWYAMQGALVRVRDRYGDHGYCGLYIHNSEERRLLHYCFSCRILGMGVEQWLYRKLGRPEIDVCGEVLTDLFDDTRAIDWIAEETLGSNSRLGEALGGGSQGARPGRVVTRGACDLGAITHYFAATFPETIGEYHAFRYDTAFRIDHTMLLRQAIEGLSVGALAAALRLGFTQEDFDSRLFDRVDEDQVVILGFTTDGHFPLYRHRETGLTVPLQLAEAGVYDLREDFNLPAHPWVQLAHSFVQREFDFVGLIGEADFKANLTLILDHIAPHSQIFLMLPPSTDIQAPGNPNYVKNQRWSDVRQWIEEASATRDNVFLIDVDDYITDPADRQDTLHFSRTVYYRIYSDIVARLDRGKSAAEDKPPLVEPEFVLVEPI